MHPLTPIFAGRLAEVVTSDQTSRERRHVWRGFLTAAPIGIEMERLRGESGHGQLTSTDLPDRHRNGTHQDRRDLSRRPDRLAGLSSLGRHSRALRPLRRRLLRPLPLEADMMVNLRWRFSNWQLLGPRRATRGPRRTNLAWRNRRQTGCNGSCRSALSFEIRLLALRTAVTLHHQSPMFDDEEALTSASTSGYPRRLPPPLAEI